MTAIGDSIVGGAGGAAQRMAGCPNGVMTYNGSSIPTCGTGLSGALTIPGFSLGAGAAPLTETWTVGSSGVVANSLVSVNTTSPSLIVAGSGFGAYGIAKSTAAAGGLVEIAHDGIALCIADTGGVAAGNLVLPGVVNSSACADSGVLLATSVLVTVRIIGRALSTAVAGATFLVELQPGRVGSLLPPPSSVSLGGVNSVTCGGALFVNVITLAGVPQCGTPSLASVANATFLSNVTGSSGAPVANALPVVAQALMMTTNTNGAIGASNESDNGSVFSSTLPATFGGSIGTTGGTSPGYLNCPGNTTAPTIAANLFYLICPNAATFSGYGLQFPSTGPTGAGVITVGAPVSGVSQVSFTTALVSSLTDSSTVAWTPSIVSMMAVLHLTAIAGSTRLLALTVSIAGHYAVELFQPVGAGQSITLTCNSNPFKIGNGGAGVVTLTNTANAMDKLTFDYDGANCSGGLVPNFN
jgi:hypothetical protein